MAILRSRRRLYQKDDYHFKIAKTENLILKIAIIGSFKQHIRNIIVVRDFFIKNGIIITTPRSTEIIEPRIDFVRFTTDEKDFSNALIQSETIKRIFSSDLVYVVAPNGYIGRTTCYEIGRIIQNNIPIYFSDLIKDLPVYTPNSHILGKEKLLEIIKYKRISVLYNREDNSCTIIEKETINEVRNG
jgi:hypothetical protein